MALPAMLHFYNHRRAHSALGGLPPISRLTELPGRHSEVTTSEPGGCSAQLAGNRGRHQHRSTVPQTRRCRCVAAAVTGAEIAGLGLAEATAPLVTPVRPLHTLRVSSRNNVHWGLSGVR